MRYWRVAGGVLENELGLLLVANQRPGGRVDWTTPGGVIDDGETPIGALRREIEEETGLLVRRFDRRLWTVTVDFVDMDMHLDVEVHHAESWTGEIVVDDPDGIVNEVEFVDKATADRRLEASAGWVAEPMRAWLTAPWAGGREFGFRAIGTDPATLSSERVS